MKKLIFITLLFTISFAAFAGGANEGRLYMLPRNVANNDNVMIELTQQKSLTSIAQDYANTSTDNLAVFRMRDTLKNSDQPSGNTITISVSDTNGWYFVNENNPTSRVRYEMNCIVTERKNSDRDYNSKVSQQIISSSTSLGQSGATTSWVFSGNNYQLTLPMTSFTRSYASYYADYIREADFCIVIPQDSTDLESGYYSTTITVTTTSYQEHAEKKGSWGVIASLVTDGSPKTMTEVITIRGYVGIDPGTSGDYSFTVGSAPDTYSMDLGITSQSTPYDVAHLTFDYTDIVSSSPASTQATKFKLYISPTNVYGVDGTYKFIKMGSENQARTTSNTLYYDLYAKSSGGYTAMGSSATWSDTVASISQYNSTHTWEILPKYTSTQISDAGLLGGSDQYKETWDLDLEVYLKLTSDSLAAKKETGLYYSYIYVTLVAN